MMNLPMRLKYSVLLLLAAAIFLFNIISIKQAYGGQSCAAPSVPQLAGMSNGNDVYLALDCLSGNELYDVLYSLSFESPSAPVGPAAPGPAQPPKPVAPPAGQQPPAPAPPTIGPAAPGPAQPPKPVAPPAGQQPPAPPAPPAPAPGQPQPAPAPAPPTIGTPPAPPQPITQNTLYNTLSLMDSNQIYAVLSKLQSEPDELYSVFKYLLQPAQTYEILSTLQGNNSYKLLNTLDSTELYYVLSSLSGNELYSVLNSMKGSHLYNLLKSLSSVELYLLLSNLSSNQYNKLMNKLNWWGSLLLDLKYFIGELEQSLGSNPPPQQPPAGQPQPAPGQQQPPPGQPQPAPGTGTGSSISNNVCAQQTLNSTSTSTSCSAQFTITAVNPSDKNSGNQRSVTSGFSTIVANP